MTDLHEELLKMAANTHDEVETIETSVIDQWRALFGFSATQAKEEIRQHRGDLGRQRISDEHWQLVRQDEKTRGHNRESYEFALFRQQSTPSKARQRSPDSLPVRTGLTHNNSSYIIRIEPPIETAQKLQRSAQLARLPPVFAGKSEDTSNEATFCEIDSDGLQSLHQWLSTSHPNFRPMTVRLSRSPKNLSAISSAPTLGCQDRTLPQHRLTEADATPRPTQAEYPVWYFFYGNLARAEELQMRLNLEEPPTYTDARVYGGHLRSWRGKYRALVDGEDTEFVEAKAYLVQSEMDEDVLRCYESEMYEVVRCRIWMDGAVKDGLVFRFAGGEDRLE